jgi:hypothetical protein
MRRALVIVPTLAAALVLAACGGADHERHAAAQPWLYAWRNFELTGIPEEVAIYGDGEVRYRNLLHTQRGIAVRRERLPGPTLATLRRLVARVDLRRADSSGVKPRRDGFRWIIRAGGRTGTAADGHLHGPMRPLVARLRSLMDHMLASPPSA